MELTTRILMRALDAFENIAATGSFVLGELAHAHEGTA